MYGAWRDDPVAGLAKCVNEEVRLQTPEVSSSVSGERPTGLTETVHFWTERGIELAIIVDQFEEYFLYHPGEQHEVCLVGSWANLLKRHDLRVSVLVSMRDDALARLDLFEGRIPALFENRLQIEHLTAAKQSLPLRCRSRRTVVSMAVKTFSASSSRW